MHARRRDIINCFQINLQRSRTATSNLGQLINQHNIDITYIQEPYTINNKLAGLPRSYKVYTLGDERKRSAIVINNDRLDVTLITQLSNEDCVTVEVRSETDKFYSVSMYFDSRRDIEDDIRQLEKVLDYTKGNGLIIAMDSNARSKMWHDITTNQRGKLLEEYLICKDLYVLNEATETPTFHSNRGSSRIDLTITNSRLVRYVSDWICGQEESCSDHNIVNFKITSEKNNGKGTMNNMGVRYITKQEDYKKFDVNLVTNFTSTFNCINKTDINSLDVELTGKVNQYNTEALIHDCFSCVTAACKTAFRISKGRQPKTRRTVPWWNDELTILRKKVNALRRRYQRTVNNNDLRSERKILYFEGKRHYQSKLQEEKFKSWQKYCSSTDESNPWNAIYKTASGKSRSTTCLTTLQRPDGTFTLDTESTTRHMLDYFVPEDSETNDSVVHKQTREKIEGPIDTEDDKPFSREEIAAVIKKFNPKKAPGEDGLTSEIILHVFNSFPYFLTEVYNKCLEEGCFPKQWKKSSIVPIIKPGKEDNLDASKYRPISLLNVAGKVLDRLLIDRITHHVHTEIGLNRNQYGEELWTQ
jgi:hypothetical protein